MDAAQEIFKTQALGVDSLRETHAEVRTNPRWMMRFDVYFIEGWDRLKNPSKDTNSRIGVRVSHRRGTSRRLSVSRARVVAQLLAKRFMIEGKMTVVPQRLGSPEEGNLLAAKAKEEVAWGETFAFASVAVQAVGYSDGIDSESSEKPKPEVVIYASKILVKEIKSLPPFIDGVKVRVQKIGLVSVHPYDVEGVATEPNAYTREGRVACGGSCSTATGYAGTLGALVSREGDESLFMLSCNHVLAACNQISLGMPILAPAPHDARPDSVLPVSIARLHEAVALQTGSLGIVAACEEDVALGRILDKDRVSSWQGDPNEGYDTPTEIVDPKPGLRVKKFGRTTGLTRGIVDSLVADPYPIHCQAKEFKGVVWFQNVAYVDGGDEPFAHPGDSGSLVVTDDGKGAVGLLFSSNGSGEFGQIIPMRHVTKKLGVTLINGHGI